jgi:hypothetical protein
MEQEQAEVPDLVVASVAVGEGTECFHTSRTILATSKQGANAIRARLPHVQERKFYWLTEDAAVRTHDHVSVTQL